MGLKIETHPPRVERDEMIVEVFNASGITPDRPIDPTEVHYYCLFTDIGGAYSLGEYTNNTTNKTDEDIKRRCAEKLIDDKIPQSVMDEEGNYIYKVELTRRYEP